MVDASSTLPFALAKAFAYVGTLWEGSPAAGDWAPRSVCPGSSTLTRIPSLAACLGSMPSLCQQALSWRAPVRASRRPLWPHHRSSLRLKPRHHRPLWQVQAMAV